ncbi:hypothetical protein BGY98DRAFT_953398 [Russula aff. rugulosa BPL654]|nr:hypothetical protein BGY98DRAFT_953398 [Russula aff. rugulosa BPL654]
MGRTNISPQRTFIHIPSGPSSLCNPSGTPQSVCLFVSATIDRHRQGDSTWCRQGKRKQ